MKWNDFLLGVWLGFAIGAALIVFIVQATGLPNSYRQGQIDAANGIMKYELQTHDDGTTSWELKGGDA